MARRRTGPKSRRGMNVSEPSPKERILALAPNWLGDVAMASPALRALRRRFPDAELAVAGRSAACQLLEGLAWIDRLIPLPSRPGSAAMLRLARVLAPHARTAAIIFPHSFRAALLAWLAGAPRRSGYAVGARSFLLTDRVAPHREDGRLTPVYMALEYLGLTTALGCEDDGKGLELHADPEHVAAVRTYLRRRGPIVGIAPGAAFGPSKQWPAQRYAAVADALTERVGAQCVLMTGPGEQDTRQAVLSAARHPLIECHGGEPSIARLKATISQVDLLIGNDSGPRHVAIAFKKPVVCIMGPTSPRYTASPWERGEVLRVDVDCGPCQQPVCTTDHRCMTRIAPEMVVDAALEWL